MRVTRSRELVAEGHSPSVVARVAQISRQAILSVPSVSVPGPMPRAATAHSTKAIDSLARQRSSRRQPTISRVQQSIAAIR